MSWASDAQRTENDFLTWADLPKPSPDSFPVLFHQNLIFRRTGFEATTLSA